VTFKTVNPADGSALEEVAVFTDGELETALQETASAVPAWRAAPLADRCALMLKAAAVLRSRADDFAHMITLEMGKPVREALAGL